MRACSSLFKAYINTLSRMQLSLPAKVSPAPFLIAAHYSHAPIVLKSVSSAPADGVASASSTTTSGPVLTTHEGSISGTGAILRFITGLSKGSGGATLAGSSAAEAGVVDSWVEQALAVQPAIDALLGPELDGSARTSARPVVAKLLVALDAQLADKTFITGHRLTLADVVCACALAPVWSELGDLRLGLDGVSRWLGAVTRLPDVASVLASHRAHVLATALTATDTVLPEERFKRARTRVAEVLHGSTGLVGSPVVVAGWAKTIREQKGRAFVQLNDGSTMENLQLICEEGKTEGFASLQTCGGTGACLRCEGVVVACPPAAQQPVEVQAVRIHVLGPVDEAKSYPLAKGKVGQTLEFLREFQHLRPRTNTISAVARIRNACAYATHKFFQDRGFLYVHTPLITPSDCEGAGEMFQVTTLLPKNPKDAIARTKTGEIDYSKDFFGKPTMLTVSGQLQVEGYAMALSDVYTFGPTFRAEVSHTARHLAEFWMIEPEIAFAGLPELRALAEDYLKFCTRFVLDHCDADISFFEKQYEPGLRARLTNVVEEPFQTLTYTEAVELLMKPEHMEAGKFEVKVHWGLDLGSEHERYLTEKVFKKPVVLINYPKEVKSFYMKLNPDGKTVAAMDVLVPKVGEIIGGSQREDDHGRLTARMAELHIDPEPLRWYTDLRRYGTAPHAGFGLGFERLVMYVTGLENIRDAIPFPRWPGNAAV